MSEFSIEVEIVIDGGGWSSEFEKIAEVAVLQTIKMLGVNVTGKSEVSILLTNNKKQRELNQQYRKIDKTTNVLSFPLLASNSDVLGLMGDISLAYQTLEKEAKEQNISFENHFTHLIVHGFLHLLGYDHVNEKQALEMETLEVKILNSLRIANPYE